MLDEIMMFEVSINMQLFVSTENTPEKHES